MHAKWDEKQQKRKDFWKAMKECSKYDGEEERQQTRQRQVKSVLKQPLLWFRDPTVSDRVLADRFDDFVENHSHASCPTPILDLQRIGAGESLQWFMSET
jgi:hypothetical protein